MERFISGFSSTAMRERLPDETLLTTAVRGRKATPRRCSTILLAASMLSTSIVLSSRMPAFAEQRVGLLEVAGGLVEEDELLLPDLREVAHPLAVNRCPGSTTSTSSSS